MDESLQRALRDFGAAPHDAEAAEALTGAALRAGELLLALEAARVAGGPLQREAADALARRLGLALHDLGQGLHPTETFRAAAGLELALVSGGAYLEDGACAWRSSLEPGGSRAALERVVLPPFLISLWSEDERSHAEASDRARAAGGRLPSAREWKKAWRGGLFLDGDWTACWPNDEPDRLRPSGCAPVERDRAVERSPAYGLVFPAPYREWSCEGPGELLALASEGRYRIPAGSPALARWRLVIPLEDLAQGRA
ncbi:MAG: hypothetical protein AB7N76_05785 [Planctomycetota bacterium]